MAETENHSKDIESGAPFSTFLDWYKMIYEDRKNVLFLFIFSGKMCLNRVESIGKM